MVKNLPAMQQSQEMQVPSLPTSREYTLEEGMATDSSIVAWITPWTEKPVRLQSVGSQGVGHD